MTRNEYGEAWPFTVDEGVLIGRAPVGLPTGLSFAEVTFESNGVTYAVNGIADGTRRYRDVDAIWEFDPAIPTLRKNIGPLLERGLALAEGRDIPFVQEKPKPHDGVLRAPVPIHCDEFRLVASIHMPDVNDPDCREVRVRLNTDLPDYATVMVSFDRCYSRPGDSETYPIGYLEEKSTVGAWREERRVRLDHTQWQAALNERLKLLRRAGESFDVASIADDVEVSFVFPVNQPDPRFAVRNEHVSGKGLAVSGLRVATAEQLLHWPVTQSGPTR